MTVVAVLGIITVAAGVFFQNFLRAQQLSGAAQQVTNLLNQARQLAITNNASYTVEVDTTLNRIRFVKGGTAWTGPGTDANGYRTLENQAKITSKTGDPVFNSLGTATAATITVQASQGTGSLNVRVSSSGRIRTCTSASGAC